MKRWKGMLVVGVLLAALALPGTSHAQFWSDFKTGDGFFLRYMLSSDSLGFWGTVDLGASQDTVLACIGGMGVYLSGTGDIAVKLYMNAGSGNTGFWTADSLSLPVETLPFNHAVRVDSLWLRDMTGAGCRVPVFVPRWSTRTVY